MDVDVSFSDESGPVNHTPGALSGDIGTLRASGSKACPPVYIGVGIGGTLDKAVSLSKEATLRPVGKYNKKPYIVSMERRLIKKINR